MNRRSGGSQNQLMWCQLSMVVLEGRGQVPWGGGGGGVDGGNVVQQSLTLPRGRGKGHKD